MIGVPERNLEAYRMLYQIEDYLRSLVHFEDIKYNASLFDLIEIAEKHQLIGKDTLPKLNWIVDVRNKVCHMQPINSREFALLCDCWDAIFKGTAIPNVE